MTVESVNFISDLDSTYPAEGEIGTLHEGNDHIRNIKKGIKATFPNLSAAMSASAGVLNKLVGLTATAGDLNVLQGAAAAGVTMTSIAGLAGLTATAGALNIMGDVTVTAAQLNAPTALTAQATTSGSAINFTSIPAWVKRITVALSGVSTNGTGEVVVQIGDSGGLETTDYTGGRATLLDSDATGLAAETSGFSVRNGGAAGDTLTGLMTIVNQTGNVWVATGQYWSAGTTNRVYWMGGAKTLSATLDRLSLVSEDTFDAGSVNVIYE